MPARRRPAPKPRRRTFERERWDAATAATREELAAALEKAYFRTPGSATKEDASHKGDECRFVASSRAELGKIAALLKKVGIEPGRAFEKGKQWRLPVYGYEAIAVLRDLAGEKAAPKRKPASKKPAGKAPPKKPTSDKKPAKAPAKKPAADKKPAKASADKKPVKAADKKPAKAPAKKPSKR